MSKLTAAVIGGGAGGKLSLAGLAASDDFELKAVTDMRPEVNQALEATYPGLATFTDHLAMFRACPTDVVCVSTWAPSHRPITFDALEHLPLKGILVEKPLGDTASAGRAILDAIKARRLPVAVPHGLLAMPHTREIIRRVRAGDIGELRLVEIECGQWDIINAGIHWINFFVMLTGNTPVSSVQAAIDATTRTYRDGMQVETEAVTYVINQRGARLVMQTGDGVKSANGMGTPFRLVGDKGVITFDAWSGRFSIITAEETGDITPAPNDRGSHQIHLEAMARQIESGQPEYAIAESSLMALEICEAAYLSGEHGCVVRFPLETFTPPSPADWRPGKPYAGQGGGRDGRKLG